MITMMRILGMISGTSHHAVIDVDGGRTGVGVSAGD
jgi:hypothetical protein